jgi:hypothetical protein
LAAIRDFARNEFAIDGHITPKDERVQSLHGRFYKSLDPATKRSVDHYALRCFKITDYQPDEPSELFYRLNQPTALTAGEQRNALYGPAREQLKQLVREFESLGNDRATLGFSNARLAYDDIIARLLFFLEADNFGIKGTETRISDRFRDRIQFPDDVLNRARRSITLFSQGREEVALRLNKASMLSWLLFFVRFQDVEPGADFMSAFFSCTAPTGTNFVREAVDLFQDRASLRVTDVSSVILRDFCLWFAYYHLVSNDLPPPMSVDSLVAVTDAMKRGTGLSFEHVVTNAISVDAWGRLL